MNSTLEQYLQYLKYILSYRLQALGILVLAILTASTSLTFPLVTKYVIDMAIPERDFQLFFLLMALQLCMFILNLLASAWMDYQHNKLCYSVSRDIKLSVFESLTYTPLNIFENKKVGDLIQRINQDVEIIQNVMCSGILGLVINIVTLVTLAVVLIWLNTTLFSVALVILPLFFFNIKFFNERIKKTAERVQMERSKILNFLVERFKNIRLIHSYNAHSSEKARYDERIRNLVSTSLSYRLYRVFSGGTSGFMIGFLSVVVWTWGGNQIMTGAMTLGSLVAFTQYLTRFYNPVQVIHDIYIEFIRASVSMRRVEELRHFQQISAGQHLFSFEKDIELVDVEFGYDQRLVFEGLSLRLEKSLKYALVGSSGCGKSTLAQLLAGFYRPRTGSICFDGRKIQEFDFEQLRANVEFVPQESQLLSESIADNIRFACPEAPDKEVWRTAELAGLVDSPEGMLVLGKSVGEQGVEMSGGERQRIAIARALLKNAQILIIDEAFSALDAVNEALIIDKIVNSYPETTIIIVTHRFSTLGTVDEIVCLDDRHAVEQGRLEKLINDKGFFYHLFEKQIYTSEASN